MFRRAIVFSLGLHGLALLAIFDLKFLIPRRLEAEGSTGIRILSLSEIQSLGLNLGRESPHPPIEVNKPKQIENPLETELRRSRGPGVGERSRLVQKLLSPVNPLSLSSKPVAPTGTVTLPSSSDESSAMSSWDRLGKVAGFSAPTGIGEGLVIHALLARVDELLLYPAWLQDLAGSGRVNVALNVGRNGCLVPNSIRSQGQRPYLKAYVRVVLKKSLELCNSPLAKGAKPMRLEFFFSRGIGQNSVERERPLVLAKDLIRFHRYAAYIPTMKLPFGKIIPAAVQNRVRPILSLGFDAESFFSTTYRRRHGISGNKHVEELERVQIQDLRRELDNEKENIKIGELPS